MNKAKKSRARIIHVGDMTSRYVAMRSVKDMSIVAHGNDLDAVLSEAEKAGVQEPVIAFPHNPNKRYIY